MYKRHRFLSCALIAIAIAIGIVFDFRYSRIAEAAITVISIALAMYIAVATALLGSPFSKSLKKVADKENPQKSMLGRLASYLKIAGTCSIITIIISTIYILKPDTAALQKISGVGFFAFLHLLSAVSCALYVYDFFLMFLIMDFLIVALLNAASTHE